MFELRRSRSNNVACWPVPPCVSQCRLALACACCRYVSRTRTSSRLHCAPQKPVRSHERTLRYLQPSFLSSAPACQRGPSSHQHYTLPHHALTARPSTLPSQARSNTAQHRQQTPFLPHSAPTTRDMPRRATSPPSRIESSPRRAQHESAGRSPIGHLSREAIEPLVNLCRGRRMRSSMRHVRARAARAPSPIHPSLSPLCPRRALAPPSTTRPTKRLLGANA